jgi:hypothetical protein
LGRHIRRIDSRRAFESSDRFRVTPRFELLDAPVDPTRKIDRILGRESSSNQQQGKQAHESTLPYD